jgi:nitrite reductase/ring-hydroxylating ferredoxin subunit
MARSIHSPLPEGARPDGEPRVGQPRVAVTPPALAAPGASAAPFVGVLRADDLPPGALARVSLGDLDLLLANVPAGLLATDDRCPHMAAPLSIGRLEGCIVDCPLHNGRFDLCSGETVQMPSTGGLDADGTPHLPWSPPGTDPKPEPPGRKAEARRLTRVRRLRYYPVRVVDGMIEVAIPGA